MNHGDKVQYSRVRPNDEVFRNKGALKPGSIPKGTLSHILDRAEYPETGGIFSYYKGVKYPRKYMPFPQATAAGDTAKRITMFAVKTIAKPVFTLPIAAFAILPWRIKIRAIEGVLDNWCHACDYHLVPYYLEANRYTASCQELRRFISGFLTNLGVKPGIADHSAEVFITLIQNDDAYRYRIEDVFGTMTQGFILKHPRKAIKKAFETIAAREMKLENYHFEGTTTYRFKVFERIISAALFVPKIRKAFRSAFAACAYERLCMDEADKYHTLLWPTYDFQGIPSKKRIEMYLEAHAVSDCHKRELIYDEAGNTTCKWCKSKCAVFHDVPPVVEIK